MMKNTEKTMEKIVALCKGRGFIFAGSEIYGGLANTWDYGPLGVELKNNVKKAWWKKFVQENPYNVGQDTWCSSMKAAISSWEKASMGLSRVMFCSAQKSSISLSARKRSLHSLQSIRGSEKPPRWPEATQVWGFIRMAES